MNENIYEYLIPTGRLAKNGINTPIAMIAKEFTIADRVYRKGSLVSTSHILPALMEYQMYHCINDLILFHLHICGGDDDINEGDYVLVNEGTVGRFKKFSQSGCDALFYESGIGYHSGLPDAEKWLKEKCKLICGSTDTELREQAHEISPDFIDYYIKRYNADDGFIAITPEMDAQISWNAKVQKFRDIIKSKSGSLNKFSTKKDIPISMIGMTPPDIALIGAGKACDEIIQKRREAGLQPNDRQYTRQQMIDFANRAIYDYIGTHGLLVDSKLKIIPNWIELNLPLD